MSSDADRVRELAGRLFDQAFRAAGWTDEDFGSYRGWSIREAVIRIAAGGEQAAVAQIIGMFTMDMPRYDPATGQTMPSPLTARCMDAIQQARHAAFPGNTGWTWDEENGRWTASRGGILVTAAWPRGQMPPVRADWFAVQKTGQPWYGQVLPVMENPGEKNLPWNHPVLAEIPEEFWTDDWIRGVRYKVILGMLCSPCGRTDARVCIQPQEQQGADVLCVPVDPDHVRLSVLNGRLSDWQ